MSDGNELQRKSSDKFRFAIDRGGTFTDVYSECPNGEVKVMKLLSVDPAYPDAPREGIRRILEQVRQATKIEVCHVTMSAVTTEKFIMHW